MASGAGTTATPFTSLCAARPGHPTAGTNSSSVAPWRWLLVLDAQIGWDSSPILTPIPMRNAPWTDHSEEECQAWRPQRLTINCLKCCMPWSPRKIGLKNWLPRILTVGVNAGLVRQCQPRTPKCYGDNPMIMWVTFWLKFL